MKLNMGIADRIIRILVAAAIVALYLLNIISGTFAYILLAVAFIFLVTSIAGSCPLYTLFGLKTCKVRQ